jgi:hypothetical protein
MKLDRMHVALIATLVYDTQVHIRNKRRSKKLQEENEVLCIAVDMSIKRIDYLVDLINKYEVPVTEFEKIVFHNLD